MSEKRPQSKKYYMIAKGTHFLPSEGFIEWKEPVCPYCQKPVKNTFVVLLCEWPTEELVTAHSRCHFMDKDLLTLVLLFDLKVIDESKENQPYHCGSRPHIMVEGKDGKVVTIAKFPHPMKNCTFYATDRIPGPADDFLHLLGDGGWHYMFVI